MSLFLAVAVVGVGCGSTDGGDNNGGNTDGGNTDGGNHGQQGPGLCSANNPCPSGQFCFNGLCAIGCQSNANCAADQYCDTEEGGPVSFCKGKTVPTCSSDSQCLSNQRCFEGLCSLKPPADPPTCTTGTPDFKDGCDNYSVCIDPDDRGSQKPYCASFPPCPENGVCPVGQGGAVCNDDLLPNKGRFCIQGACKVDANCPSQWSCVKPFTNAVLGFCSPGSTGFPCNDNAQCASKQCMQGFPGTMGVCM
jgi:hypothetical protein